MASTVDRTRATQPRDTSPQAQPDPKRWLILGVIAVAQLMIVLDTTIVNIALPSAQADLGFADTSRQWVISAYALAFGSLLLLGGRLSDLLGRRNTLLVGLLGFAGASVLGGLAPSFALLVSARVLQGVFAAVLAPAALSTLNVVFTDAKERGKALGVYAAIAGGGSAVGLLLGGVLTEYLSWRWCLYVNLFFAVPAAVAVVAWLGDHAERRSDVHVDAPGAVTAVGGLFALVFGLSNAEQNGWSDGVTLTALVVAVVLLVLFVVVERRVSRPLLPLRVVTDRSRGAAYLSISIVFVSLFGAFLFLTYFMQQNLGFSALVTGVAFLPLTAGVVVSAGLTNTRLLPRFGPRPLVPTGMLLAGAATLWLSQLSTSSAYWGSVAGPLLLLGLGMGLVVASGINTATDRIDPADQGVGSAMVNTSQQIGGAIGAAVLSTIFATAVRSYAESRQPGPTVMQAAAVHGYAVAFAVGSAIFAVGAVLAVLLFRSGPPAGPAARTEPAPATTPDPVPAH